MSHNISYKHFAREVVDCIKWMDILAGYKKESAVICGQRPSGLPSSITTIQFCANSIDEFNLKTALHHCRDEIYEVRRLHGSISKDAISQYLNEIFQNAFGKNMEDIDQSPHLWVVAREDNIHLFAGQNNIPRYAAN